jgi:hypothetical protein
MTRRASMRSARIYYTVSLEAKKGIADICFSLYAMGVDCTGVYDHIIDLNFRLQIDEGRH